MRGSSARNSRDPAEIEGLCGCCPGDVDVDGSSGMKMSSWAGWVRGYQLARAGMVVAVMVAAFAGVFHLSHNIRPSRP